jgi:hypothetical protein
MALFGSKKKGKPSEAAFAPDPSAQEPLEFREVAAVPAAVGAARALRAVRAHPPRTLPVSRGARPVVSRPARTAPTATRRPRKAATATRRPRKAAAKGRLTAKQLAQRKYAARMRTVRKRAKTTAGGKGRIAKRSPATKLRRKLGLKPGKTASRHGGRKGVRKKR